MKQLEVETVPCNYCQGNSDGTGICSACDGYGAVQQQIHESIIYNQAISDIQAILPSIIQEVVEKSIEAFWDDADLQEAITRYGEWNDEELEKQKKLTVGRVIAALKEESK